MRRSYGALASKFCVQQKFAIPFRPTNWRIDDVDLPSTQFHNRLAYSVHRSNLSPLFAHNSSLTHLLTTNLELWLNQNNQLFFRTRFLRGKSRRHHRRQHHGCRNERHIHHDQVDRLTNVLRLQISRVGLFQQPHPRVTSQSRIDLPVPRIHRDHSCCSVLQQAVCETSGGGPNIKADAPTDLYLPALERPFQFQPASADIFLVISQQANRCVRLDRGPRFLDLLLVNQDLPGEDQRLAAFPRRNHSSIN